LSSPFFHFTDGKRVLNNHKGIVLAGNAAARDDAAVIARDLKHGEAMPGWNWEGVRGYRRRARQEDQRSADQR
jgi:hypothetical protein